MCAPPSPFSERDIHARELEKLENSRQQLADDRSSLQRDLLQQEKTIEELRSKSEELVREKMAMSSLANNMQVLYFLVPVSRFAPFTPWGGGVGGNTKINFACLSPSFLP